MKIYGTQKLTLLDYPGHTACTLFTGGCNLRCPFCQNSELINVGSLQAEDPQVIQNFLLSRKELLDGVCICGGEPTLQERELRQFIAWCKSNGFKVKLDTNGTHPEVLHDLLENELLDYVAMDIKAPMSKYDFLCGRHVEMENIGMSITYLEGSAIDHEFRTTFVRPLLTVPDFETIGVELQSVSKYFIQAFRDGPNVLVQGLFAPTPEEMQEALKLVKINIPNAQIRGI